MNLDTFDPRSPKLLYHVLPPPRGFSSPAESTDKKNGLSVSGWSDSDPGLGSRTALNQAVNPYVNLKVPSSGGSNPIGRSASLSPEDTVCATQKSKPAAQRAEIGSDWLDSSTPVIKTKHPQHRAYADQNVPHSIPSP
jgi:hypothetical protein